MTSPEEMPEEIDFTKAERGRHHVPAKAAVFLPASIDVLKRDIEIVKP